MLLKKTIKKHQSLIEFSNVRYNNTNISLYVSQGQVVNIQTSHDISKFILEHFLVYKKHPKNKKSIIKIMSYDYNKMGPLIHQNIKKKISIIYPKKFLLIQDKTIYENIKIASYFNKISKRNKEKYSSTVENLISYLNISHVLNKYPKDVSKEDRCKTILAHAVLKNPKVVILYDFFNKMKEKDVLSILGILHKIANINISSIILDELSDASYMYIHQIVYWKKSVHE